jgi:hypothetical protein
MIMTKDEDFIYNKKKRSFFLVFVEVTSTKTIVLFPPLQGGKEKI